MIMWLMNNYPDVAKEVDINKSSNLVWSVSQEWFVLVCASIVEYITGVTKLLPYLQNKNKNPTTRKRYIAHILGKSY